MKFYLSYVTYKDRRFPLGHAELAISTHDPEVEVMPKVIFRVGLFASSQLLLEDFIVAKPGRKVFHKTYELTEEQFTHFMQRINADRRLPFTEEQLAAASKEGTHQARSGDGEELQDNIPHGPQYNVLTNNCKTYALSVMRDIGIDDPSLGNVGIDLPVFSGKMRPFYVPTKRRDRSFLWTTTFRVTRPDNDAENESVKLKQALNATLDLLNLCIRILEEKQALTTASKKKAIIANILGDKKDKKTLYGLRSQIYSLNQLKHLNMRDVSTVLATFEEISRTKILNNQELKAFHNTQGFFYKLGVFISDSIKSLVTQFNFYQTNFSTESLTKYLGRQSLFEIHSIKKQIPNLQEQKTVKEPRIVRKDKRRTRNHSLMFNHTQPARRNTQSLRKKQPKTRVRVIPE